MSKDVFLQKWKLFSGKGLDLATNIKCWHSSSLTFVVIEPHTYLMNMYHQSFRTIILAALIFLFACRSVKTAQNQSSVSTELAETANSCSQTIKYFSDKIKTTKDGQEISVNTEIVINPSEKTITVTSNPPDQEKVSFITTIESTDCEFGAGLTNGYSIYNGYIKQLDGTTTKAVIKVEAKDGSITMSNASPEKESEFIILVSNWEVINE